jgi:hypothetical protein
LKIIAFITDADPIQRILIHIDEPATAPRTTPCSRLSGLADPGFRSNQQYNAKHPTENDVEAEPKWAEAGSSNARLAAAFFRGRPFAVAVRRPPK